MLLTVAVGDPAGQSTWTLSEEVRPATTSLGELVGEVTRDMSTLMRPEAVQHVKDDSAEAASTVRDRAQDARGDGPRRVRTPRGGAPSSLHPAVPAPLTEA